MAGIFDYLESEDSGVTMKVMTTSSVTKDDILEMIRSCPMKHKSHFGIIVGKHAAKKLPIEFILDPNAYIYTTRSVYRYLRFRKWRYLVWQRIKRFLNIRN